ncbi:anaerobic ribonucleoside-triphosphate reductase activating protein [delta proteobacterium NaphS2]|nr:anaerobic ribonucleoside-triphosphate reductase activating protein [delta proteobacterium NaphS2]
MIIGGIQKSSLIDYSGKISCVVFLAGCNFTCPYCHNPDLVRRKPFNGSHFDEKKIYAFLESRKGFLDGVVISGGEPTLNEHLPHFLERIKHLGYPVKLDTNGTRPRMVRRLIDNGLIDYIAMDIKADPLAYPLYIAGSYNPQSILTSVEIIRNSELPHEFRTTCVKPMVNEQGIRNIAQAITVAPLYALQRFCDDNGVLDPRFFDRMGSGHDRDELIRLQAIASPWVKKCVVRS